MAQKTYTNDASGNLFNTIRAEQNLTSDLALAKALGVAAPVISKIRAGRLSVGATLMIRIHEAFGYEIKRIKALVADKAAVQVAAEATA